MPRLPRGRAALIGAFVLLSSVAYATVTQVDGTIIPVPRTAMSPVEAQNCNGVGDDDLQVCFDTAEATPVGDPDRILIIQDASEFPQIFKPRVSSPVQFFDTSEGGSYENSFGYYNIGDDVTTTAGRNLNLHPILGCGTPMAAVGNATTHAGEPLHYLQNAEPNNSASVNFAAEATAGRYKGGFIGFYLITPQGQASNSNCGDFKNDASGNSKFGRIYFTQKDLNDDGDFVHHLVYSSKKTAERFYFAFEDLFRGGDKDYEDMFIRADGLTPPCVPQTEVCDGEDNDCDGLIDTADPDMTEDGAVCQCTDAVTCDNGPQVGVCQPGETVCVAGVLLCHGHPENAGTETCDGLDNDCDGVVDDGNLAGEGVGCDGNDLDLCVEGQTECVGGVIACNDNTGNAIEFCDGLDNDCDGANNEGDPGGGAACGSDVGRCEPGIERCLMNMLQCTGAVTGITEQCNGIDDDCNGVADNNPSGVGVTCGATDQGACDFGMTICVSGAIQCGGEVGATPEICNSIDDDCNGTADDNPVDDGQVCGVSTGACEPGAITCVAGVLACTGGIDDGPETCNNIDDDCNGIVDDAVPGVGNACVPPGGGMGACGAGTNRCINGAIVCVGGTSGGTETCNNVDDDCDGNLDEGDLCAGGVCEDGVCASPCVDGEFRCPSGKRCVNELCLDDPCANLNCPPDANGALQTCTEGACVALCSTLSCPLDTVCRATDGACVPDTCEYLPKCAANELCVNTQCVSDPCEGVTCGSDEFCRAGECARSCQGVDCGAGQTCRDGSCVATGCARDCTDTEVCDPQTRQCVTDRCQNVMCPPTQACNGLTGQCEADPCNGVVCPGQQVCSDGQCGVGTAGALITTGGGGGCSAGGEQGSTSFALFALAVGWMLRRSRKVRALVVGALAATTLTACDINKYCIGCDTDDTGGDDEPGDDGGIGDDGGGGGDGGVTCDPLEMRQESCNNTDDDCDGLTDENFDRTQDELNCGACGVECNKPGAITQCQAGACVVTGCFPGFVDYNMDNTTYATSDGCEVMCFQSNGGVEACDGIDNDCDGDGDGGTDVGVDEGFNTTADPDNCGVCGRRCEFFQATSTCASSTCSFDPATDCNAGFVDADGMQMTGCEYACTPSNGGTESCDVRDNDCDGRTDEGFDFMTDVNNCARCGRTCSFPFTVPRCTIGICTFDPMTDCVANHYDINGNVTDGCEYACTPSNGGIERCDGVDNDCDGLADDSPVDAGGACSSTPSPTGACVADGVRVCGNGVLRCQGATEAVAETCNNTNDDCDTNIDEGVTQSCYTGADPNTNGVGVCRGGTRSCATGVFGSCVSEVVPSAEQCDNEDDDCDTRTDEAAGGGPLTRSCYTGTAGTAGRGVCTAGTETCRFGSFSSGCVGQVTDSVEVCGDTLNTDCDLSDDAAEGCQVTDNEVRLDEATAGAEHSYDIQLARGGDPNGSRVYAVWSQLVGGATEVYYSRTVNGGTTWSAPVNLTDTVGTSVKPMIAVAPGTNDLVVVAFQTFSGNLRDVRVRVSRDSGTSWDAVSTNLDASGDSFHHAVAVTGTTIALAWETLNTTTLNRDIATRVWTDSATTTFGTENKVNTSSTNTTRFAGRPQVGVTSAGRIVWAWREQRSGATRDVFAASAASVAAATPGGETRIDGDTAQNRDADFPRLAVSGAAAYLTWQDVSTVANGGSDVMFARSADGGGAWTGEVVIDDPGSNPDLSASFTPTIAVDPLGAGVGDDIVALAWEDRRQGTQAFARVSLDGGATFGTARRASNIGGTAQPGVITVPVIASSGTGVLSIAYENKLDSDSPTHVFLATSIDNGATWTYTADQLDGGGGSALLPAITAAIVGGAAGAIVGWADFRTSPFVNGDIYTAGSH